MPPGADSIWKAGKVYANYCVTLRLETQTIPKFWFTTLVAGDAFRMQTRVPTTNTFVSGQIPTINVSLAAVRRLAYEASDTGLLSPDLAAGIRRVKGAKHLGMRIGNWLTLDQSKTLLQESSSSSLRGKRDRAIVALLIGCGLLRAELVGLRMEDFQVREEHSVIADLIAKGKHIRTVRQLMAW
jgi:site-specific recombinase XerC